MILYMEVTQDEYSYPKIVTKSIKVLAVKTGKNEDNIRASMYKNYHNPNRPNQTGSYRKWEKVIIPDDMSIELVTDEMWEHYQRWNEQK